jgi:chitinase
MKTSRRSLLPSWLATLLAISGCNPAVAPTHEGNRFAVIAYSGGRGGPVEGEVAGKLTHIIYSFAHLRGDSIVLRGPRDSSAIASLVSLKKQNPHLKVMLSLGGWGGCATCSETFAAPGGRKEFAASVLRLLKATQYPSFEGYPGHRFSPDDRHNFTLLMKDLRETLGEGYDLSFAAGGFADCIRASIEWNEVMKWVDRVNVMTYDLVNAASTVTGHQTALLSGPLQRESAENALRLLDSLGVPREKIVIGSAFYARVWGGVRDTNNGLFQTGKFVRYVPYRFLGDFLAQSGGFRSYWDSTSQAPYSYSAEQRLFATYDDPRSVSLKTAYATEQRLGGIMFWELSGDAPQHGLLAAIDSTRRAETGAR